MREKITEAVKESIISKLGLEMATEELGEKDYLLVGGLGLDSISAIELVVELEERFEVYFGDDELHEENFSTVEKLVNKIESKLN